MAAPTTHVPENSRTSCSVLWAVLTICNLDLLLGVPSELSLLQDLNRNWLFVITEVSAQTSFLHL